MAGTLSGIPVVEDALSLPELIHESGFEPAETDLTGQGVVGRAATPTSLDLTSPRREPSGFFPRALWRDPRWGRTVSQRSPTDSTTRWR